MGVILKYKSKLNIMKDRIIEIIELGQPQSLIQRENAPVTELVNTDVLIEELNKQLNNRIICHNCENPYPHAHTDGSYSCEECGSKWRSFN